MRIKTKIFNLTLATFLVLGFQNCSPYNPRTSFSSESSLAQKTPDSGTPYEGKMFAVTGDLCADGTEIHSRITTTSLTTAFLNRENCRDIKSVSLTSADFQIDEAKATLTFKGEDFKFIGNQNVGITNLAFSNDATRFYYSYTYEGQPSWLQIFLDTDNNPATGFSHHGIGADFLIENDQVWIYSAAAGSPPDTWSWASHSSANKINTAPTISWNFPKSTVGSPLLIKFIAQTSLGARTSIVEQTPQ